MKKKCHSVKTTTTATSISVKECPRGFLTPRGTLQHSRQCKINNPDIQPREPPDPEQQIAPAAEQTVKQFYWVEYRGSQITK